jgi:hypothetical protein
MTPLRLLGVAPRGLAGLLARFSACCRRVHTCRRRHRRPARDLRLAASRAERADRRHREHRADDSSLAMFSSLLPVPFIGGVGARAAIVVLILL